MEAAYKDGGPGLDDVLDYLNANLELVRQHLDGLPDVEMIEPGGTFLLWLDFRKLEYAPEELTAFLKDDAKWAVTRGQAFGPEGVGFVRLNISCTKVKLAAALDNLSKAVATKM